MIVLKYIVTAWICSICVNAGIDAYVSQCYPACPSDQYCREGRCVCKRGNAHSGRCVECPAPRVYKSCPSNCPRSCDDDPDKPIRCTRECNLSRYCVCPDGYVETSKTDSTCIKKELCPLYCKPPKVRINCIPGCIGTCQNPNGKPGCRNDLCLFAISCGCPAGYVQRSDTDSTCVKLKDCPNQCRSPKVYTPCATSCPDTCDNIGQRGPRPCITLCRPGVNCVCPEGYVETSDTDSTCVRKSACPCELPKEVGPCEASIPSFYFNAQIGKCQAFDYGGCQGNANRFTTRSDCEDTCSTCKLDKDPGPCKARIRRYYYNKNTDDCEMFWYGGCRGNANRFTSLSNCRQACTDPCIFTLCLKGTICKNGDCIDICQKPKVYKECSTSCPITCDNVDNPPTICTADCRPDVRCVCPKGYVERSSKDSTCVLKSQCPQYQCRSPKVYTPCATSCPDTCDNIGQRGPRPCITLCRPGVNCVCPEGYVETSDTDSTCVRKSACPCELPKEVGPCEASIPSFYFNAQIGKCQAFDYGGCQGNANRFTTRSDCEDTCSTCKLDKDPGPCKARIRRYYYNKNTGDCEMFWYGGCRGNANRFTSLSNCRQACADPCKFKCCPCGTCKNGKYIDSCYPKICRLGSYCKKGMCVKRCGSGYCGSNGICLYNKCLCLTPGYSSDCAIY